MLARFSWFGANLPGCFIFFIGYLRSKLVCLGNAFRSTFPGDRNGAGFLCDTDGFAYRKTLGHRGKEISGKGITCRSRIHHGGFLGFLMGKLRAIKVGCAIAAQSQNYLCIGIPCGDRRNCLLSMDLIIGFTGQKANTNPYIGT